MMRSPPFDVHGCECLAVCVAACVILPLCLLACGAYHSVEVQTDRLLLCKRELMVWQVFRSQVCDLNILEKTTEK